MNLLITILFFNFLGSIVSLIGGVFLLFKNKSDSRIIHLLSSFAAGSLLGAAFFDLLPEALEHAEEIGVDSHGVVSYSLYGILFFFLLERFLHWSHNHDFDKNKFTEKPVVPLIIAGDSVHNFIDGIAIAATFMLSVPLGIVTTLAVAIHEIPQEIGDFAVMIKNGVSKGKVLFINFFSACASIIGALIAFYFGQSIEGVVPFFIAIASGFFLYIALSTLIPEIHHENKKGMALAETISLFLGVATIYFALFAIENILGITP